MSAQQNGCQQRRVKSGQGKAQGERVRESGKERQIKKGMQKEGAQSGPRGTAIMGEPNPRTSCWHLAVKHVVAHPLPPSLCLVLTAFWLSHLHKIAIKTPHNCQTFMASRKFMRVRPRREWKQLDDNAMSDVRFERKETQISLKKSDKTLRQLLMGLKRERKRINSACNLNGKEGNEI